MSAWEDFERVIRVSLGEGEASPMVRKEAIEAVESAVSEAGLDAVLQAYLASSFDAQNLHLLNDEQLGRALLFVAQMMRQAPQPRLPWPGGAFEGEFIWVKGKVAAAGG